MSNTKFVSVDDTQKEKKETIFTHRLDGKLGWQYAYSHPLDYNKVVHLGMCEIGNDMFAAYGDSGIISIFKGIKGDEFNQ